MLALEKWVNGVNGNNWSLANFRALSRLYQYRTLREILIWFFSSNLPKTILLLLVVIFYSSQLETQEQLNYHEK